MHLAANLTCTFVSQPEFKAIQMLGVAHLLRSCCADVGGGKATWVASKIHFTGSNEYFMQHDM